MNRQEDRGALRARPEVMMMMSSMLKVAVKSAGDLGVSESGKALPRESAFR